MPIERGGRNLSIVKQLVHDAREAEEKVVQTRRMLHADPELGWEEFRTTKFIRDRLSGLGFQVTSGREFLKAGERLGSRDPAAEPTGCVADLRCARPGPTVALRFDIDALPIEEADQGHRPGTEGWRSRNPGVMHACGHDGHIAIGLTVAELIALHRDKLPGLFRIIAQPAEEGTRGARSVVQSGWLNDVDVLYAFHIGLGVPSGSLALGVSGFLATRKFAVTLRGAPAHAGKSPQSGRNALAGACQVVLALYGLAQSSEPGVRANVGSFHSGNATNVVPDLVEFGFELRAERESALERLADRAEGIISGISAAYGLQWSLKLSGEACDWSNPARAVKRGLRVARTAELFRTHLTEYDFAASEDATLMARAVSDRGGEAGYFILGSDLSSDHHTYGFDFDESVLPEGAAFLAAMVADVLTSEWMP